jgi:SpoVK/Ycf46/Vps4 family AAA+-type ATPase
LRFFVDLRRRIERKLAKRHYLKGNKLFEADNLEGAIREYTAAISLERDYASAYLNRSLARGRMNDIPNAKVDAQKAIRLEPNCWDAPYVLGVLAEYEEQLDDAKAWYENSLKRNPEYASAKERYRLLLERLPAPQTKHPAFGTPSFGFEAIVGLERAKEKLYTNVVLCSKRPDLFAKYGTKPARGVLLCGPPGVGKTTLASAVAKEAGANFKVARIDRIVDMYAGNTEKNIHAIFEEARGSRPCVLFIDEVDGLGLSRNLSRHEGDSPCMALAVSQLLVEIDGVEENPDGLFIIGATNQPEDLDPALKERFAEEIHIDLPSHNERKKLFEYFIRNTPHEVVDYERLAGLTQGYSPRKIKQVCGRATTFLVKNEYEKGVSGTLTTEEMIEILGEDQTTEEWTRLVSADTNRDSVQAYA